MVFFCPKKKNQKRVIRRWTINQFAIEAGMIYVKDRMDEVEMIENLIKEEYGKLGSCKSLGKCSRRMNE